MIFTSVLITFIFIHYGSTMNAKGSTPLDSWTFDKITSRFKASIIKFDIAYPYGKKHEEFVKLAAGSKGSKDLFVGEVGVKDYGDMENSDLAERFGVNKDDFPVVKLFISGTDKPIDFKEEFNVENLKNFLRKNADVYVGLPNCLETYDRLADRLRKTSDEEEKKALLNEAETEYKKLASAEEKNAADYYIKVMQKMIEKGSDFVWQERRRIRGLIKEKVSNDKKDQMQGKLNILESFIHDEL